MFVCLNKLIGWWNLGTWVIAAEAFIIIIVVINVLNISIIIAYVLCCLLY